MKKSGKMEANKESIAMEVLEWLIMRLNVYLSKFHVFDYIAKIFIKSYLTNKAFTWYNTWKLTLLEQDAFISWSDMQE